MAEIAPAIKASPENFTVEVSASVTLEELDDKLRGYNQESSLQAPLSYTISQILSENWNNECHKSCLGLKLKHKDGRVTKTGGQVIKNVSGYDLSKIYIGSDNQLIKIESVFLKTFSLPERQITLRYKLSQLPNNIHEYILDWDNTELYFSYEVDSYYLAIKLSGAEDILALRKAKLEQKLSHLNSLLECPAELRESEYKKDYETEFTSDKVKLEIYTQVSNLAYLISELKSQGLLNNRNFINPKYGKLSIYLSKADISELKLDNAYAHIYPVTQDTKELEQSINKINKDEEMISAKLKSIYN